MKKFINYLKSPKSDIFLFVLLLILANLVVSRSYFRIDLTSPKSYSLSKGSAQVVKTLEEPLSYVSSQLLLRLLSEAFQRYYYQSLL